MRHLLTHLKARRKSDEGFSMVELAFVLLLIALLIGIGVPTFLGIRERGQDSQATNALRQVLSTARATVLADNGNYPANVGGATPSGPHVDLAAAEPQYTFVNASVDQAAGVSNGPDQVGVHVVDGGTNTATLYLVAESPSGACFVIRDNISTGTQYAELADAATNACQAATAATVLASLTGATYADNW